MKRYDMKTRQGRARRRGRDDEFNPHSLQLHTADSFAAQRNRSLKASERAGKAARWNDILHGEHKPAKAFPDA